VVHRLHVAQALILYNTLMAIAAASGLILIVLMADAVRRSRGDLYLAPWAWAFAALGLILVITGAHMTLTWPLNQKFPAEVSPNCCLADNIIFGEPSLYLGALLLSVSASLISAERRRDLSTRTGLSASTPSATDGSAALIRDSVLPLSYAGLTGGLMLFVIGFAGAWHGMFIAPPNEPFSSLFRFWNVETIYVLLAYWLIGIGAVLTPFALRRRTLSWYWGASLVVGALMIGWLGLVSFFGHIALAG
jgi:uncharacterized membrane protein